MFLYLRDDLLKSKGSKEVSGPAKTVGQLREGHYVARVQVGNEKDGSPKYRYFKTAQEYEKYLKSPRAKGTHHTFSGKIGAASLEAKTKREHRESTEKLKKPSLLKPKRTSIKKSVQLFVKV